MAVKFSIIVPIYNAEKYLKECVDSVLLQTFNNYEIVLVNDGSTDNSYEICVEYEKNFKEKIHIYTKKNEGLSATRNFGLSVCSGDYLMILFVKKMLKSLQDMQVIIQKWEEKKTADLT